MNEKLIDTRELIITGDSLSYKTSLGISEPRQLIKWFGVDELPDDHTHVLTVDMNEEFPIIWHNVHSTEGHFCTNWGERKRKPTHWAHMNFPE